MIWIFGHVVSVSHGIIDIYLQIKNMHIKVEMNLHG